MTFQEAKLMGVEALVLQGERFGMTYDAFGRNEDLDKAIQFEKAAFALHLGRPADAR